MKNNDIEFVFFGTPDIAVWVLEELKNGGLLPSLIVTAPDKPQGRKMILTPPPAKVWAEENNIPVIQPEKLDYDFIHRLQAIRYTLFIIAAYGKIIPQKILDIPEHGTLNVHPSILPKFRGASPVISAILSGDEETGTTIMVVDAEMDHGPIIAQERIEIGDMDAKVLGEKLARLGGIMLSEIVPKWIVGEIEAQEQEHDKATYTRKITKEDGLITLDGNGNENWRKFRAFVEWPGTYFFTEKNGKKIRTKITNAELKDGAFVINRVIPEGKKEIEYKNFFACK